MVGPKLTLRLLDPDVPEQPHDMPDGGVSIPGSIRAISPGPNGFPIDQPVRFFVMVEGPALEFMREMAIRIQRGSTPVVTVAWPIPDSSARWTDTPLDDAYSYRWDVADRVVHFVGPETVTFRATLDDGIATAEATLRVLAGPPGADVPS